MSFNPDTLEPLQPQQTVTNDGVPDSDAQAESASEDARIYTNDSETFGERLAADITKTAALALPERGMSTRGTESITRALGNAAVSMPKLPEIDLEGFGLGL